MAELAALSITIDADISKAEAAFNKVAAFAQTLSSSFSGNPFSSFMQNANETAKSIQQITTATERASKATRNTGAYKDLSDQFNAAAREAKNFGAALIDLGIDPSTNRRFLELSKRADGFNESLKKLDTSVGQYGRNVGNYKSHWDGLGNSISQIAREFPAFIVSMQTGFLAISNNLPALFDEIKRIRVENAALAKEGKAGVPVWKQVAGSFLSWNMALNLGVTALTILGPKLIDFITSSDAADKKNKDLADSQKRLNDTLGDSNLTSAIKGFSEMSVNIRLANDGLVSKDKVLKEYNSNLGRTIGHVNSWNELENIMLQKGDAYIQLQFKKAQANAFLSASMDKMKEAAKMQLDNPEDHIGFGDKLGVGLRAAFQNNAFSLVGLVGNFGALQKSYKAQIAELAKNSKAIDIIDSKNQGQKLFDEYIKAMQEAGKYAKDNKLNFFENDKPTKDKKPKKTVTEDSILAEYNKNVKALNNQLSVGAVDIDTYEASLYDLSIKASSDLGKLKVAIENVGKTSGVFDNLIESNDYLQHNLKGVRSNFEEVAKASKKLDNKDMNKGFAARMEAFNKDREDQNNEDNALSLANMKSHVDDDKEEYAGFIKTGEGITEYIVQPLNAAVEALIDGQNAVRALSNSFKQLAVQIGEAALKAAVLSAVLPGGQVASLGGFGGIFKKVLGLADGGIISGTTPAIVGEYAGAKTNPEVIAPLNKLKSLIGSSGQNINVNVTGKLRGNDIMLSNQQAIKSKNR